MGGLPSEPAREAPVDRHTVRPQRGALPNADLSSIRGQPDKGDMRPSLVVLGGKEYGYFPRETVVSEVEWKQYLHLAYPLCEGLHRLFSHLRAADDECCGAILPWQEVYPLRPGGPGGFFPEFSPSSPEPYHLTVGNGDNGVDCHHDQCPDDRQPDNSGRVAHKLSQTLQNPHIVPLLSAPTFTRGSTRAKTISRTKSVTARR